MDHRTIKRLSDLNEIIEAYIQPSDKNDIKYHNMWAITLDDDLILKIGINDLSKFLSELLDNRRMQLRQLNLPAIFYFWFDLQALQLRFNILTGNDISLPFGCKVHRLNSPMPILEDYLTTAQTVAREGDIVEYLDIDDQDDENEKEYILDVYVKLLPS